MDIELLLRVGGVGFVIAILCQVLSKLGRDEISGLLSVGGILLVLFMLVDKLSELLEAVRTMFDI
jgi:stage III sporulation protein AC